METVAGGKFDVESLCQEYVNGQSTSEAPKLLARGTYLARSRGPEHK